MKKRISWTETFAFAKAKRKEFGYGGVRAHIFVFMFCFFLFTVLSFLIGKDGSILKELSISLVAAFVLGFPVLWLLGFMPNSVSINKNGIACGKLLIPYKNIKHASVGMAEFQSVKFVVLVFLTNENIQYMYGIPEKLDKNELQQYLESNGVKIN